MRRLGLVYGAIDLRLTGDGRYVFLEINPAGQFLYVEEQTGQPIAAALAAGSPPADCVHRPPLFPADERRVRTYAPGSAKADAGGTS